MRKIHGASLHRGLQPDIAHTEENNTDIVPVKEETRLETELRKAVESEDFERAAELRDKLQSVRDSLTVE